VKEGPPKDERGNESNQYIALRAVYGSIVLLEIPLILTISSGWYTYHGALALGADAGFHFFLFGYDIRAHSLLVSVSATSALFVIIFSVMGAYPHFTLRTIMPAGLICLILAISMALSISSYFNLVGLIGNTVLMDDIREQRKQITQTALTALGRIEGDKGLSDILQGEKEFWLSEQQAEIQHGKYTGFARVGPVSDTLAGVPGVVPLGGIAGVFERARVDVDRMLEVSTQQVAAIKAELDLMDDGHIDDQTRDDRARQEEFYLRLNKTRILIQELFSRDVGGRVEAAYNSSISYDPMDAAVSNPTHRQNTAVAQNQWDAQQDALNKIASEATKRRNRSNFISGLVNRKAETVAINDAVKQERQRPSVYSLVIRRLPDFIPFGSLAVLLDVAWFPVLLIKWLIQWQMTRHGRNLSALEKVSAAEAREIRDAFQ
jgi:hypothetical protein